MPRPRGQYAGLAQSVVRAPCKRQVLGSTPRFSSNALKRARLVPRVQTKLNRRAADSVYKLVRGWRPTPNKVKKMEDCGCKPRASPNVKIMRQIEAAGSDGVWT